jgi:catechol 2,3-dioxygenase-like lactoylglutathione lyase family enzyme
MKLRHIGVVTNKLDESLEFYKIFGFEFKHGKVESGEYVDRYFGKKKVSVLTVKLKNEFNECIELLRFDNVCGEQNKKKLTDIGLTHITFEVENLDESFVSFLEKKGIEIICDIQVTPTGHKVLFCKDPNNVYVELVKEP